MSRVLEYLKRFWMLLWRAWVFHFVAIVFAVTIVAKLAPVVDTVIFKATEVGSTNDYILFLAFLVYEFFSTIAIFVWAFITAFFPGKIGLYIGIVLAFLTEISFFIWAFSREDVPHISWYSFLGWSGGFHLVHYSYPIILSLVVWLVHRKLVRETKQAGLVSD